MYSQHSKHQIHREMREAYLADDILFDHGQDRQVTVKANMQKSDDLPMWLDTTRLICFLIGTLGIFCTFMGLGSLAEWIHSGFLLNLILLISLTGFSSYLIYPYLLKYVLVNKLNQYHLLRFLNNYLLVFSAIAFLVLMSWPIMGLGLSLIFLPVPVSTALFTRRYLQPINRDRGTRPVFNFYSIFDHDLRRLAWISFFTALMALMSILILLGI